MLHGMKKVIQYIFIIMSICVILQIPVMDTKAAATLSDKDKNAAKTLDMGRNYSLQWEGYAAENLPYKFTIGNNGILGIKVEKALNTMNKFYDCTVRIYGAAGQEIITFANKETGDEVADINVGLPAGTYYVKIWLASTTPSGKNYSYNCSFEATENSEREKNDTKETATVMALNTEYTGYIGGATNNSGYEDDKYDVYKVSLTKGGQYQLTSTDSDLICMLLTSDKAIDSTSGIGCNVTYTAAYTGDYYVVVYNSNKYKPQSSYKVMVKKPGSDPQTDPGSTPGKETDPGSTPGKETDPDVAENKDANYNPKISPKPPKLKSIKSSKKKITIKWKKVSCNGYIIQYGTKKSFKGAKKKVITSGKKTKLTIKKLKKGKKYYVRIRAYKVQQGTKYYSKWSGKKSIKVK